MDTLTQWDADPAALVRVKRRELGARLGADLARSGPHPLVLRLFLHGEPVERASVSDEPLETASMDDEPSKRPSITSEPADNSGSTAGGVLRDSTIAAALGAGLLDEFEVDGARYLRARACVLPDRMPTGELVWVAADLPWESGRVDHVPGPGNASRTLLNALAVQAAATAADVGTGCGVVALHLSTVAERVVATDVNPRALAYAELTAALNGRHWDLRLGSFLEPIAPDEMELLVANPPFVIGNPDAAAVFRDGDVGLAQALARDIAAALPPGSTAQFLGNWAYTEARDATADVLSAAVGVDCLVVERAVVEPTAYVGLWTDDSELHARWVANLRAGGVVAIGTGIVTLHRPVCASTEARAGVARLYDSGDEPLGPAIADWLAGR